MRPVEGSSGVNRSPADPDVTLFLLGQLRENVCA